MIEKNSCLKREVSEKRMKEATQNTMGVVLDYVRNKYEFSLLQVCNGLCAESTLHNIEMGERKNVDSLLGELLLDRLGREVTQFELVLDDCDYQRWSKRDKIMKAMQKGQYEEVEKELEEYEAIPSEHARLHKQFCLFYRTKLAIVKSQDVKEIQKLARSALHISKPKVETERDTWELYTQTEIELILILIHYGYKGLRNNEEWELIQLLHHVETFYTGRKREDMGLKIIMEFIELCKRKKDDNMILKCVDRGIELIAQGREIKNLAQLHFMKAQILFEKYSKEENFDNYKKQVQEECLMAYSIYLLVEKEAQQKEIEQFCEEKMQWQITELVM